MAHKKEIKKKAKEMLKSAYPGYVADKLGVPISTVYNWLRETASEERTERRKEFLSRREVYHLISSRYADILLDPETIKKSSPRDAAVVMGIMQDKLFKLDRFDKVEFSEEAAEKLLDDRGRQSSMQELNRLMADPFPSPRKMDEDELAYMRRQIGISISEDDEDDEPGCIFDDTTEEEWFDGENPHEEEEEEDE